MVAERKTDMYAFAQPSQLFPSPSENCCADSQILTQQQLLNNVSPATPKRKQNKKIWVPLESTSDLLWRFSLEVFITNRIKIVIIRPWRKAQDRDCSEFSPQRWSVKPGAKSCSLLTCKGSHKLYSSNRLVSNQPFALSTANNLKHCLQGHYSASLAFKHIQKPDQNNDTLFWSYTGLTFFLFCMRKTKIWNYFPTQFFLFFVHNKVISALPQWHMWTITILDVFSKYCIPY